MLRIVTYSSLYPNAVQARHGIFVEQRLRQLVGSGAVQSTVLAPVPWVPRSARLTSQAVLAEVPAREQRHGLEIHHPRYAVIPKVGMTVAPALMHAAVHGTLARLHAAKRFDLIDAHYLFPDGVAAVASARRLGLPVVLTARGTDVNLIPQFYWARRMILWAVRRSEAVITVSKALADRLIEIGAPPDKLVVLRNGVDLERFRPLDRDATRASWGFEGRMLLSVGHLIERKGHDVAIRALALLPEYRLAIAGDGPLDAALRRLAAEIGVADRVRFLGARSHDELVQLYSAADALVLASDREGMPNVVLESLACGTPVIGSAVWGTPEVVDHADAGQLFEERSPAALAAACRRLEQHAPTRAATRRHAERFGWDATTNGQLQIFNRIVSSRGRAS